MASATARRLARPETGNIVTIDSHPAVAGRQRSQEMRFAECRSMGHSWRHRPPVGIDDDTKYRRPFGMSTGMVGFPSRCSTCGTERVRWITRSGEVIMRYEHPDGYERHGDERLTATQWRRSYVSQVFDGFLEPEVTA